jgi:hypothetical protein
MLLMLLDAEVGAARGNFLLKNVEVMQLFCAA